MFLTGDALILSLIVASVIFVICIFCGQATRRISPVHCVDTQARTANGSQIECGDGGILERQPPWPVVRVRKTDERAGLLFEWANRVLHLTQHHVRVVDTRGPITEQLLQTGEPDAQYRSWISEAKIEEIQSVHICPWTRSESVQNLFQVTASTVQFTFALTAGESIQVIRALQTLLKDRVEIDPRVIRRMPAQVPAPNVDGATRRPAGRYPLRSTILGWLLKCVSLAAVCFLMVVWLLIRLHPNEQPPLFVTWKDQALQAALIEFLLLLLVCLALYPMYYGYKLCQRTIIPFRHDDTRAPVIFLRAFGDDERTSIQPAGWVAEFHGLTPPLPDAMTGLAGASIWRWGLSWRTYLLGPVNPLRLLKLLFNADRYYSEELFAGVFRNLGPFVAIGRPGELIPTPGAYKMYVRDDEWQEVVLKYLALCQAVVLQPSKSAGVRWEVEQVLRRVPPNKVLLCLSNFHQKPDDYDEFRHWVAGETEVRLPLIVPFLERPSLVYFEHDGTPRVQEVCYRSPLLWSFIVSGVDEKRTFTSFLRGLKGDPCELPCVPRHYPGQKALSVALILTLWWGPVLGLMFADDLVSVMKTIWTTALVSNTPYAKGEIPQRLPEEVVIAGKKAGAEVGWIRINKFFLFRLIERRGVPSELPPFLAEKEGMVGDLPALKFSSWKDGVLATQPAPNTAFGISLFGTQITDAGMKELVGLHRLQSLSLGSTPVTDAGMKELAGLKDLQSLSLGFTQVTDAGLKELTGLKELQLLDLRHTLVTDAGLKELNGFKRLRWLLLDGTKVTDAGKDDLLKVLPDCIIICSL